MRTNFIKSFEGFVTLQIHLNLKLELLRQYFLVAMCNLFIILFQQKSYLFYIVIILTITIKILFDITKFNYLKYLS